ncbi:hypothetical protein GCM10011519_02540 [Marmoricola endophyticus]|uniref:Phosphodiesterase n=1 Tax=Marmoricola endophyticus TaxID=2040280 RepID=A0A917BAW5_9ACTN|nr:DUF5998 family protein [Marmoricola endophyticus]GGF32633.1 hypothetical protein GCM10011519_02540 [Marmoricola endophyticus]
MRSHTSSSRPRHDEPSDRTAELVAAVEQTGYYPVVVNDGIAGAVAGEPVLAYLVHHEPTIDRDEVRRHITVAVITPSRLVIAHTDENPPDELLPEPYTSTSTEAIGLGRIRSVVVNRMVANPGDLVREVPPAAEAVLTVGWGGVSRVDLEPAGCADPECDADHGYTGVLGTDDFSLRVSAAADGQGAVDLLLAFAETLSASTQHR